MLGMQFFYENVYAMGQKSSSKGKPTRYLQGNSHNISADFSAETLKARRDWHGIFKVIKRKKTYSQEYFTWQVRVFRGLYLQYCSLE